MAESSQPGPDQKGPALVVALTGGIASGKTAVSDAFARLGVAVIDTDRIAHELVEPGQALLDTVIATFGDDIVDSNGRLRRRRLRELVFANPDQRHRLETLLHPAILEETRRRILAANGPYCIVVIPLLTQVGVADWVGRVLVVDVAEAIQIDRVIRRDKIDHQQARSALAAQASRQERLSIADDVIENSGTLAELENRVTELHQKYLNLAA